MQMFTYCTDGAVLSTFLRLPPAPGGEVRSLCKSCPRSVLMRLLDAPPALRCSSLCFVCCRGAIVELVVHRPLHPAEGNLLQLSVNLREYTSNSYHELLAQAHEAPLYPTFPSGVAYRHGQG